MIARDARLGPLLAHAVRGTASVALAFVGQALVLGCDRVPILPPTEATPVRPSAEQADSLPARWSRARSRHAAAHPADLARVDARIDAITARRAACRRRDP